MELIVQSKSGEVVLDVSGISMTITPIGMNAGGEGFSVVYSKTRMDAKTAKAYGVFERAVRKAAEKLIKQTNKK